jgi:sporulation protein YlmC with PRC-barrel domain
MVPDKWQLYRLMYYSRLYENAVMNLWNDGKILGEIADIILESGLSNIKYRCVCTEKTIAYSHQLEKKILPGTDKILNSCRELF